ncbi:hypothetical protein C0V76_01830 [Uliginosibacterium sp. TH139]|nr:hypothetical protein C0V76_01830 [Uliginosibacterium sp. TH139]
MVSFLRRILLPAVCLSMSACLNAAPDALPWLQGEARIATALEDFPVSELELSLYRIGPPDRAAELIERRSLPLPAHVRGAEARLPFSLGQARQYQAGERYYFTAYILLQGQRSHAGRCGAEAASTCPVGEPATMQALQIEFDALPATRYEAAPLPSRWR